MKIFLKKARKWISNLLLLGIRLIAPLIFWLNKLIGNVYTKLWQYAELASYEHRFDYLRGMNNFYWLERGIFGLRYLPKKAKVLDLGCGDGVYSGVFYSTRASEVEAMDYDPKVIALAKKFYKKTNVFFSQANITKVDLIAKNYDAVYLFAVIEHFTFEQGQTLIKKIALALKDGGYFMGSTPLFLEKGGHNVEHQNEFSTEHEVKEFMASAFLDVETWISSWPNRDECYFLCRSPK